MTVWLLSCVFFFFFKQKTAYEMRISDWSSDVCSSDLRRADRRGHRADPADRRRLARRARRIGLLSGDRPRDARGGPAANARADARRLDLYRRRLLPPALGLLGGGRQRLGPGAADRRAGGAYRSEERRVGEKLVRTC